MLSDSPFARVCMLSSNWYNSGERYISRTVVWWLGTGWPRKGWSLYTAIYSPYPASRLPGVSGQHSLDTDGITGPLVCNWCRKGKYDLHVWASGLPQPFFYPSIQFFLIPFIFLQFRYCNGFHLHLRFLWGKTGGNGLKIPSSTLELWREVVPFN